MKETVSKNARIAATISATENAESAFVMDANDTSYNALSAFRDVARFAKIASQTEIKNALLQIQNAIRIMEGNISIIRKKEEYLHWRECYKILIEMAKNAIERKQKGILRRSALYARMQRNNAYKELNEMKEYCIQHYSQSAINLILESFYESNCKIALYYCWNYGDIAKDAMQIASTQVCKNAILAYCRRCIWDKQFASQMPLSECIFKYIKSAMKRIWRYAYIVTPSKSDNQLKVQNVSLKERNKQSFLSMEYETSDKEGNSVEFGQMLEDERAKNAIQYSEEEELNAIKERLLNALSPLNRAIVEGIFLHKKEYRELHNELLVQFPNEYKYSDYNGLYYRTQKLIENLREQLKSALLE